MDPVTTAPNPTPSPAAISSPAVATPIKKNGNSNRRRMFISAGFIAVFAIVGLVTVLALVNRQSFRRSEAANCTLYTMVLDGNGDVVVQNDQSIPVDQMEAQLYINDVIEGSTFTVPRLEVGEGYTASGVYTMPTDGVGFTWRIDIVDSGGTPIDFCGGDTFNGTFADATTYTCGDLAGDKDIILYTDTTFTSEITDYSTIAAGDTIVLAVAYTQIDPDPQYLPIFAEFTISDMSVTPVVTNTAQATLQNGNEYYVEYTIPGTYGDDISISARLRMENKDDNTDLFWL